MKKNSKKEMIEKVTEAVSEALKGYGKEAAEGTKKFIKSTSKLLVKKFNKSVKQVQKKSKAKSKKSATKKAPAGKKITKK